MPYREVNLKATMPTVAEARKKLVNELVLARQQGMTVLKIIHGYGSSGEGGALRVALRQTLAQRQRDRKLKAVVPGEQWNIFDETSRQLLEQCPDLSGDLDLGRHNNGVTLILL
jgi:hypothetical protein